MISSIFCSLFRKSLAASFATAALDDPSPSRDYSELVIHALELPAVAMRGDYCDLKPRLLFISLFQKNAREL